MTVALADIRISKKIAADLLNYADAVLTLPPHPSLPRPVDSHPDMLLWNCGSKVITYGDYLTVAKDVFETLEGMGYNVLTASQYPADKYPRDVSLNCAVIGRNIICNKKFADDTVLETAKREGLELIHSNQGYAKCSTLPVAENALITADASIFNAAINARIDALLITQGHVRLDGYDTGFIGGATGVTDDAVLFCGDISAHPDAQSITDFCLKYNKKPVSLSDEPLYDYGTVFFFESK